MAAPAPGATMRTLVVSQRHVSGRDLVANSAPFEFEDLLESLGNADIVTPRLKPSPWRSFATAVWDFLSSTLPRKSSQPSVADEAAAVSRSVDTPRQEPRQGQRSWGQSLRRRIRQLLWSTGLNRWVAPAFEPISPEDLATDYDLIYCLFTEPWGVFSLRSLPDWQKRSKHVVCHFAELWPKSFDDLELLKHEYAGFDKIYSSTFFSRDAITAITGVPCDYLPMTVDAVKFCPYPHPPQRTVDVNYIGRRSPITHAALLELSQSQDLFYVYDTVKKFRTHCPQEHRLLLANQLKRTRYFFANCSKLDDACTQGCPPEFGWRFFEGIASGTIVMGKTPATDVFHRYFNWQDAVIDLPFDLPDIGETLDELDAKSDYLEAVRHRNILNALERYDWLYIWRRILQDFGLTETLSMRQRQQYLYFLAELVRAEMLQHSSNSSSNPGLKAPGSASVTNVSRQYRSSDSALA